jgi:hypothetical protein
VIRQRDQYGENDADAVLIISKNNIREFLDKLTGIASAPPS